MITSLLILQNVLLFSLAGVAVRIQFSLLRGFDVFVGGLVLVAAESYVATNALLQESGVFSICCSVIVSFAVTAFTGCSWNYFLGAVWPESHPPRDAVLVASLGAQSLLIGLVGFLRGPGLSQAPVAPHGSVLNVSLPLVFSLLAMVTALVLIVIALRSRVGFALTLYGEDPEFAVELGVERSQLLIASGLITSAAAWAVGASFAMTDGSRLEIGLPVFLYGAASALVAGSRSPWLAVAGGALLGGVHLLIQLFLSALAAEMAIFVAVAVLLITRGTPRREEGVR